MGSVAVVTPMDVMVTHEHVVAQFDPEKDAREDHEELDEHQYIGIERQHNAPLRYSTAHRTTVVARHLTMRNDYSPSIPRRNRGVESTREPGCAPR
jgi:hypothetical protein